MFTRALHINWELYASLDYALTQPSGTGGLGQLSGFTEHFIAPKCRQEVNQEYPVQEAMRASLY
jgi:hypothetical protein